jgi:HSP20 family protein
MANLLIRDPFLAAPFRLMDEILRSGGNGGRVTGFTPPVDVHETEDEYLVKVDLPGVKSEDVNIEVNDSVLSLSG